MKEQTILITEKQHKEFTFNGVQNKKYPDGRSAAYIIEPNLDSFCIQSANEKITVDQAMVYAAVCLLQLDVKMKNNFEVIFDKTSKAGFSVFQRDGILESNKLNYNHDLYLQVCKELKVPTKQKEDGTIEYDVTFQRPKIAVFALQKAFKMYDIEEQNDIVVTVEQVNETIVTAVETMPLMEQSKEIQQPQINDFQQLLQNIDNVIESVQNDKLSYSERSRHNTKLSVYADRLANHLHIESNSHLYEKHKAEKQEYFYYDEYMADPKNTAENGKRPSDAAAKNYAGKLTLELTQAAEMSEQLVKYIQLRIKTISAVIQSIIQEISNEKRNQENSKNQV